MRLRQRFFDFLRATLTNPSRPVPSRIMVPGSGTGVAGPGTVPDAPCPKEPSPDALRYWVGRPKAVKYSALLDAPSNIFI